MPTPNEAATAVAAHYNAYTTSGIVQNAVNVLSDAGVDPTNCAAADMCAVKLI